MQAQRQQQWRQILAATQQLHVLAEAEEWDALLSLYQQRDEWIHDFFAEVNAADEADFLREAIPQLIKQDEALQALCANARTEAARELGKLGLGRKAEAAYHRFR
jgi:hypothetical protein